MSWRGGRGQEAEGGQGTMRGFPTDPWSLIHPGGLWSRGHWALASLLSPEARTPSHGSQAGD